MPELVGDDLVHADVELRADRLAADVNLPASAATAGARSGCSAMISSRRSSRSDGSSSARSIPSNSPLAGGTANARRASSSMTVHCTRQAAARKRSRAGNLYG